MSIQQKETRIEMTTRTLVGQVQEIHENMPEELKKEFLKRLFEIWNVQESITARVLTKETTYRQELERIEPYLAGYHAVVPEFIPEHIRKISYDLSNCVDFPGEGWWIAEMTGSPIGAGTLSSTSWLGSYRIQKAVGQVPKISRRSLLNGAGIWFMLGGALGTGFTSWVQDSYQIAHRRAQYLDEVVADLFP